LNRDFLYALSANTGGFTVADTNSIDEGIDQIFRENGSYYLLGYEPSGPRAPGRFYRVEVRVNRPDFTVRSRSGYYEPEVRSVAKESGQPPLATSLGAILPATDLALQATAAPFALRGRKEAAIAIALAVRQTLPQNPERVIDNVTAQLRAYDEGGKRRASDSLSARIVVRPGVSGEVVFELLSRLDLPPGRYQLRIAARSSIGGKIGSVYSDLEVPDFRTAPLSLSGVVVSATPGLSAVRNERVGAVVPVMLTSLRGFDPDEGVTVFARVYEGGTGALRPVTIAARIRDASDGVLFEQTAHLGAEEFTSARSAEYRLVLPIARLQQGPHLLTIVATMGDSMVRRDVRFAVR
jgi:hypothetical protein